VTMICATPAALQLCLTMHLTTTIQRIVYEQGLLNMICGAAIGMCMTLYTSNSTAVLQIILCHLEVSIQASDIKHG